MKKMLLVLACLVCLSAHAASKGGPQVGDKPPLLKVSSLLQAPASAKFDARSLRGKVVVLEFWATWCGPCVAAVPHLNELADKFKDQPVRVVAITAEDESVVKAFLAKRPIRAWIAFDADRAMNNAYGVVGIPHTVVLGKDGRIAAITHPTMLTEQHLKDLLAGKKVSLREPSGEGMITAGKDPDDKSLTQPLFQVLIRPTSATNNSGAARGGGQLTARAYTVLEILSMAFDRTQSHIVVNTPLPDARYDLIIRQPRGTDQEIGRLLRLTLESAFGIIGRNEIREADVMVLKASNSNTTGLTVSPTGGGFFHSGPGIIEGTAISMSGLLGALEGGLKIPVVDETGLTNRYDISLKWDQPSFDQPNPAGLVKAVRDQLGLELVPARRSIEMLVVEEANKEARDQER